MYETVFPWAAEQQVPVLFTSSYMRFVDSGAYATVKRMGEEYVRALLPPALGRFVRLWNIYGSEPVSLRSHVLSDWSWQCVHHGFINSTTDAAERRQFLHVDDAAASLVAIYEHWHDAFAPAVAPLAEEVWRVDAAATSAQLAASAGSGAPDECSIDISSGEWSGLLDVADTIADVAAEDLDMLRFHQEGMRRAVVDPALAPAALPGAVPVALAEVSAD